MMKSTACPFPRLLAAAALLLTYPLASTAAVPDRATLEQARTAAAAAPQAVATSGATVIPPVSVPYGRTYEEWSVIWWQWYLALTIDDVGSCPVKRLGPVVMLPSTYRQCSFTVPANTALFVNVGNVHCSDLEIGPMHGGTPSERVNCAASYVPENSTPQGGLSMEVDDVPVPNLTSYRVVSPDFPFVVSPENIFNIGCGSYPCSGNAAGAGYYVMLAPLPAGVHNIRLFAPSFDVSSSFRISVEPGREGNGR